MKELCGSVSQQLLEGLQGSSDHIVIGMTHVMKQQLVHLQEICKVELCVKSTSILIQLGENQVQSF